MSISTIALDEFQWRGLVYDTTEALAEALVTPLTAYIGFDPTASSLHVGSLLPIMGLARLQRFGHAPIALVGGGTGLIGDPSGKSQERNLLTLDQVAENAAGIRAQLERFLDFGPGPAGARMANNAEWLAPISLSRVPARRRQALHGQRDAGQGIGEAPGRE